MMRALFVFIAMCAAGPALALSCLAPDPAHAYQLAAQSDKSYVVVYGTFEMNRKALPKQDLRKPDAPRSVTVPAQFSGKVLTKTGFDRDWQSALNVTVTCTGPWCATAPRSSKMVAFVEKKPAGYELTLQPCGTFAFEAPTADVLDAIVTCHTGGPCKRRQR